MDQLRGERHESVEGNRTIIREPDRTIIREGKQLLFATTKPIASVMAHGTCVWNDMTATT
jgi:hypothetical protein